MARMARRGLGRIRTSVGAGVLGLLAGVGLAKEAPPQIIDADPAASNTLTIGGSNVRDGSLKFQDFNKLNFQKFVYLKSTANRTFLKLTQAAAKYLKIDAAAAQYLKISDAATQFLKHDDAAKTYYKITDADARFVKIENAGYVKLSDADARYIMGDGSVFTGSQQVGATKETLITVPDALRVEASTADSGKTATLTLTNLTGKTLQYACTVASPFGGGPQNGSIQSGGTAAILIGLLLPAVVQVIPGAGDGGSVQTFNFTGFAIGGGEVQVVGQALSR